MSYYVSLGIAFGIVLTIPINKGYWSWKSLYLILAAIEGSAVLVNIFYHRLNVSFYQYVEHGKKEKAGRILGRYLEDSDVKDLIREEEEFYDLHHTTVGKG